MSDRSKILIVSLVLVIFVVLVSYRVTYKDVDVNSIGEKVKSEAVAEDMINFDALHFKKDFGMNAADFEGICYYGYEDVMHQEKLLIVKSDNAELLNSLKDTINKDNTTNKKLFKSYAIDQYELLDGAVLEIKGQYLIYVVNPKSKSIYKKIISCIK